MEAAYIVANPIYIQDSLYANMQRRKYNDKTKFFVLVCLSVTIIGCLSSAIHHGSANAQNKTSMEPTGIKNTITNATKINHEPKIILVLWWANSSDH
ncbi:MAG: hypothetical protein WBZ36_21305 [Candidatus Nitrosopolaris sp.]